MDTEKQNVLLKTAEDIQTGFHEKYPDWYCGMYLQDNKLVVLTTDDDNDYLSDFLNDDVVTRTAEYSYNYLMGVKQEILQKLREPDSALQAAGLPERFVGCGIFDEENRINVSFEELSEHDIQTFKELVTDSPAVVLSSGEKEVDTIDDLQPGNMLNDAQVQFTLGYGAKSRKGAGHGLVTCGHIAANVNDIVYYGSRPVGPVIYKKNDKALDASFITITEPYNMVNKVAIDPYPVISQVTDSYVCGASVAVFAGKSSKKINGKIKSSSYNTPMIDDIVLCDMVTITQKGDSGSPLLIDRTGKLVGILKGLLTKSTKTYLVFVKATKINSTVDLELL